MWRKFIRGEVVTVLGCLLYLLALFIKREYSLSDTQLFVVFLICTVMSGFQIFQDYSKSLMKFYLLDENLLMILGALAFIATGYYVEGAGIMVFFGLVHLTGEFLLFRSQRAAVKLLDIRPTEATRKIKGGELVVEPIELRLRHIIIIKPGERVPVDAVVTKGETSLNTRAITGESTPQIARVGSYIYSGSINMTGVIEARVRKTYEESVVSKIMDLVLATDKTRTDEEVRLIRVLSMYTLIVLLIAACVVAYPIYFYTDKSLQQYIFRAIIFIVAACPCGLLLSAPIALTGGIRCAAKHGMIVKGGRFLDRLSRADTFVFDKTGTLTKGDFGVTKIYSSHMSEEQLLEMVAYVESHSTHPISMSLQAAYGQPLEPGRVKRVKEDAGYGISASFDGKRVHIGNVRMMERLNVNYVRASEIGTAVYVAIQKTFMGYIVLGDTIKEDAKDTLRWLKEKNNSGLVMLTGDSRLIGTQVGKELKMDYVYSSLLPEEKLAHMEDMLAVQRENERVVFVGDGINDAPVLVRADVGIAMGSYGSQAAIEAADIVLMDEGMSQIVDLIRISNETMSVVHQNLTIGMILKAVVLGMALLGYLSLEEALLIDGIAMIIFIWNATWIRFYPMKKLGSFQDGVRKIIRWFRKPEGFRGACKKIISSIKEVGVKVASFTKTKIEQLVNVFRKKDKGVEIDEEQKK